jgi:hypothetical protein
MPNSVQQGQGICAICVGFEYDVVYVVRNPVMAYVKFGITNSEGKSRLRVHRGNGFTEVIRLETRLPQGLAEIIEKKIRIALDMAGAKPVRGREYFSDEHIALIENEIENWVPLPGQLTPAVMLMDSPIVAIPTPPVTVAGGRPQVTVDPFELAAPTPEAPTHPGRPTIGDDSWGVPGLHDRLPGCELERFGMGSVVMLGQYLTEVAGPVGDGAMADLAARDRQLRNGYWEATRR